MRSLDPSWKSQVPSLLKFTVTVAMAVPAGTWPCSLKPERMTEDMKMPFDREDCCCPCEETAATRLAGLQLDSALRTQDAVARRVLRDDQRALHLDEVGGLDLQIDELHAADRVLLPAEADS